jgi:hypothetical protein
MGFFFSEEDGVSKFASWLELEIVVIKFEKNINLERDGIPGWKFVFFEG